MLFSKRRPAGHKFFLPDAPSWHDLERDMKVRLIAHEWLTVYEGHDSGPLSRFSAERWETLFDEVGYFSVTREVREVTPGVFKDSLQSRPSPIVPSPLPQLFRAAPHKFRERWSWTTSEPAARNMFREKGEVWTTSAPEKVFGHITEMCTVLPGSSHKPELFEEFIVRPGHVQRVTN